MCIYDKNIGTMTIYLNGIPSCQKDLLVAKPKFCPYCGEKIKIKKSKII